MRARAIERPLALRAPVALALLVLAFAAVRLALALAIPTPFIFIDELFHSELAKSVAAGSGLVVRGRGLFVSVFYPVLLAPAWLFRSPGTAYHLAKAINVAVMTLAVVPVYLWGRRFLSPRGALVAAGLTLCIPSFAFTGALMLENAFFPAFLLALFACALCVEEPTPARQGLALAAIALASLTRVQGLLLLPVLATALLAARAPLRRLWPSGAVVLVGAVVAAALIGDLGVYHGARTAHYTPGGVAVWTLWNLGELILSVGVVPACALVALREGRSPAERAFLAVAWSGIVWLVLLGGVASAWVPHGIKERYMFHAAPLFFLATSLWLERGAPRPRWALVPAALAAILPLGHLFAQPSLIGHAFALLPFWRVAHASGGTATAQALLEAGVVAAALVFLRPRLAVPALALFLLVSSGLVSSTLRNQSLGAREVAAGTATSWIDHAIGSHAYAEYLNATEYEPETVAGQWWQQWAPVWEAEFWNRALRGVLTLGAREPAPIWQDEARLDWGSGRIVGGPQLEYVLVHPRFTPIGRLLAGRGPLALFRVSAPLQLASTEEGVFGDGWMRADSAYSSWVSKRRLLVVLSAPRRVRVRVLVGTLAPSAGGGAHIARQTAALPVTVRGRSAVPVAPPAPPFRVEVHSEAPRGERLLRVSFG